MAKALNDLIEDAALRRRLGSAGPKRTAELCDPVIAMPAIERELNCIIESAAGCMTQITPAQIRANQPATIVHAGAAPARQRSADAWGFLEFFILAQVVLPALLFLPGTQSLRVPIRVAPVCDGAGGILFFVDIATPQTASDAIDPGADPVVLGRHDRLAEHQHTGGGAGAGGALFLRDGPGLLGSRRWCAASDSSDASWRFC